MYEIDRLTSRIRGLWLNLINHSFYLTFGSESLLSNLLMQSPRQVSAEEHLAALTASHEQLSQSHAALLDQLNQREASIRNLEHQVQSLLQAQQAHQAEEKEAALLSAPTIRPKILPPAAFDGQTPHLDDWIFQWTQYFNVVAVPDETSRVAMVGLQLSGDAVHWYQHHYERRPPTSTAELFADMIQAFVPVDRSVFARSELASLVQKRSVDSYIERFRALCLQIPDLSEAERLDRFLRGLKSEVFKEVFLRDPKRLEDAMSIASRLDALGRLTNRRAQHSRRPDPHHPPRVDRMDLDNVQVTAPIRALPAPDAGSQVRRTRLTNEERQHLRRTGACFYCRRQGHMRAQCPVRPRRRDEVSIVEIDVMPSNEERQ